MIKVVWLLSWLCCVFLIFSHKNIFSLCLRFSSMCLGSHLPCCRLACGYAVYPVYICTWQMACGSAFDLPLRCSSYLLPARFFLLANSQNICADSAMLMDIGEEESRVSLPVYLLQIYNFFCCCLKMCLASRGVWRRYQFSLFFQCS